MIDAEQVLQHLRPRVPAARTFGHAWFTDALDNLNEETPAVFVYPGPEKAHESELDNFVSQQVEGALVVVIVARHSDLDLIREQIRDALLGWQLTPFFNGLQYVEGERFDALTKYVWWRDIYSDQFHIRQKI